MYGQFLGLDFNPLDQAVVTLYGQFDLISIIESPDEVSAAAFGLAIVSSGNIRMQTLRAFNRDEMRNSSGQAGLAPAPPLVRRIDLFGSDQDSLTLT